jgi:hypothetical protein
LSNNKEEIDRAELDENFVLMNCRRNTGAFKEFGDKRI